jgi:hypothetical protein
VERAEWREGRGEPSRVALERRVQVLNEVDLVDVAAPDRVLDGLDRGRVAIVVPGPSPLADPKRGGRGGWLVTRVDPGGEERQAGRLGRIGPRRAPEVPGDAVAEENVGHDVVAVAEEALVREVALQLGEGVGSAPDLEHALTLALGGGPDRSPRSCGTSVGAAHMRP